MGFGGRPFGSWPWGGTPPAVLPAVLVAQPRIRATDSTSNDLRLSDDGDYIEDGFGSFTLTATAQPATRHQILDRLGEWVGDFSAGREQRGIAGRNASELELELEQDSVVKALDVLEREGLIMDSETVAERVRDSFAIRSSSRDAQTGDAIDVSTLSEFGV